MSIASSCCTRGASWRKALTRSCSTARVCITGYTNTSTHNKIRHLYLIARLAMQGSDLVPVTVSFADMNGDGKPDMVVTFNSTQWIWFNNGTTFVPKL